jgi:hypothetical protein
MSIEQENNDMLRNQINEVAHHSSEIKNVVTKRTRVEPWVVAKMERASSDLSDVTHYLDGERYAEGGSMYAGGGEVSFTEYKGESIMYEPHFNEYYVGDAGPFSTMDEAKSYIDGGSQMPVSIRGAYERGLFADGGAVRKMGEGDAVLYKGETWYISEKDGVMGIEFLGGGSWGSSYPFISLDKLDMSKVTDMNGKKIEIENSGSMYAGGGWVLYDQDTERKLGEYETESEAREMMYEYPGNSGIVEKSEWDKLPPNPNRHSPAYYFADGGKVGIGMMAWRGREAYNVVGYDDSMDRWVFQSTTSGMQYLPKDEELKEFEFIKPKKMARVGGVSSENAEKIAKLEKVLTETLVPESLKEKARLKIERLKSESYESKGLSAEQQTPEQKPSIRTAVEPKNTESIRTAVVEVEKEQPKVSDDRLKGKHVSEVSTYIPHRNIESITFTIDGKAHTVKGSDIFDGIYVENKAVGVKAKRTTKAKQPKVARTQFEEEEFEFGSGGYTRPSGKVSGIYEFQVKNGVTELKIVGFERENDTMDSLYFDDSETASKSKYGSILVKNNAMSKLAKGSTVMATSKTGIKGKLTRIKDLF